MIGVIPAAGYSTRVARLINYGQKAAYWVRFMGKSMPMVCRQIEFLRGCGVNEVYVVLGYKADQVKEVIRRSGFASPDGYIYDREVRGLGNTWRTVYRELGEPGGFVSLNVDDFIVDYELQETGYLKRMDSNVGVIFGVFKKKGEPDKSSYLVEWRDMTVKRCFERGGKTGYIGCGMYYLVGPVGDTKGNEPGEVINELLMMEYRYVFKEVDVWIDMGNPCVLRYYLDKG